MPSIRTVRSRALAAANPSTYTSRPVPRPPSRARLPSDDVFGPSFERLHSTTTASTVARRQPQSLSLLAQAMAMAGASSGPKRASPHRRNNRVVEPRSGILQQLVLNPDRSVVDRDESSQAPGPMQHEWQAMGPTHAHKSLFDRIFNTSEVDYPDLSQLPPTPTPSRFIRAKPAMETIPKLQLQHAVSNSASSSALTGQVPAIECNVSANMPSFSEHHISEQEEESRSIFWVPHARKRDTRITESTGSSFSASIRNGVKRALNVITRTVQVAQSSAQTHGTLNPSVGSKRAREDDDDDDVPSPPVKRVKVNSLPSPELKRKRADDEHLLGPPRKRARLVDDFPMPTAGQNTTELPDVFFEPHNVTSPSTHSSSVFKGKQRAVNSELPDVPALNAEAPPSTDVAPSPRSQQLIEKLLAQDANGSVASSTESSEDCDCTVCLRVSDSAAQDHSCTKVGQPGSRTLAQRLGIEVYQPRQFAPAPFPVCSEAPLCTSAPVQQSWLPSVFPAVLKSMAAILFSKPEASDNLQPTTLMDIDTYGNSPVDVAEVKPLSPMHVDQLELDDDTIMDDLCERPFSVVSPAQSDSMDIDVSDNMEVDEEICTVAMIQPQLLCSGLPQTQLPGSRLPFLFDGMDTDVTMSRKRCRGLRRG